MHTSRLSRIGSGEISNNSYGDPMLKAPRVTHTSAAELTAGYYRRFRWTEEFYFLLQAVTELLGVSGFVPP